MGFLSTLLTAFLVLSIAGAFAADPTTSFQVIEARSGTFEGRTAIGNQVTGVDQAACRTLCRSTPGCQNYSYFARDRVCTIFSSGTYTAFGAPTLTSANTFFGIIGTCDMPGNRPTMYTFNDVPMGEVRCTTYLGQMGTIAAQRRRSTRQKRQRRAQAES